MFAIPLAVFSKKKIKINQCSNYIFSVTNPLGYLNIKCETEYLRDQRKYYLGYT